MRYSNFHTHTVYCDGSNTPLEMVQSAIQKGFLQLGFSGHGYTPFDLSFCMSPKNEAKYKKEIEALKLSHGDKLKIFFGCEEDITAPVEKSSYDYVISSYHYIEKNGEYLSIDGSERTFCRIARECFGGDYLAFAKCYYRQLAEGLSKGHGAIIGHLDLFTKYNEGEKLFSESDPRYRTYALEALEAAGDGILEVNTGAMARGYRKSPYPAEFLLKELAAKRKPIILTSDCHQRENLDFAFDETVQLLKNIGFKEDQILFTLF